MDDKNIVLSTVSESKNSVIVQTVNHNYSSSSPNSEFEKELESFRYSIESQILEFEKKHNCSFVIQPRNYFTALVHLKTNSQK
jgi:hypothetical protein